jgi:hypothetical protein
VGGFGAAREAFDEVHRIQPGCRGPTAILLEHHVVAGPLGEQVPISFVPVLFELADVVVKAAVHIQRFERGGDLVEGLGQCLALFRIGKIFVAGDDEEFAADDLVKLNGPLQGVAAEGGEAQMSPRSFQLQAVELLPQFLGFAVVFVVTGKFDAVEAHLGQLRKGGVKVLGAIVAHGVELDGNREGFGAG